MTVRDGRKSNARPLVFLRREKERMVERLDHVFAPLTVKMAMGMFGSGQFGWTRRMPKVSRRLFGWETPPIWPKPVARAPEQLRSYAGTQVDDAGVTQAYREKGRLMNFNRTHIEAVMYTLAHAWTWMLTPYPNLRRSIRGLDEARALEAAPVRAETDPARLSALIEREAARLGISGIGFTKADVRFTFAGFADPGDANIIVCALEQDKGKTNTAPSSAAERAAFRAYGDLQGKIAALATYVKSLGYETRPNDWGSQEGVAIKYAVEAGMGQLGLNGQLLTPAAGSRLRLGLITTQAPVQLGAPADFGIPRVCDECQLCVRRCPTGAIPIARKEKRGVTKASINPERCFPMVAQAHGCAVCMKVCPVQKFGLPAVVDHFERTGEILGKGTDALEGYVWPLDGRYYGPGEKPGRQELKPEGWHFDRDRLAPPGEEPQPAEPRFGAATSAPEGAEEAMS
jgi:epoxyqueuosine reductase